MKKRTFKNTFIVYTLAAIGGFCFTLAGSICERERIKNRMYYGEDIDLGDGYELVAVKDSDDGTVYVHRRDDEQ